MLPFDFSQPLASVETNGTRHSISPLGECAFEALKCTSKHTVSDCAADWTVYLENTSRSDSGRITNFCGLDLTLPLGADEDFVWRGLAGDGCSEDSFRIQAETLRPGDELVRAPIGGRSSNTSAFPFFDFTCGKRCFCAAIGWSGQWELRISRGASGVRLTARQQNLDVSLRPGERIRSVRILLYAGTENADETAYAFREYVRKTASPYAAHGADLKPPVAVQVFDRYYWNNTENYRNVNTQLRLADKAGSVGKYNTFWLDAMWFRDAFPTGVGNYAFAEGFPEGLAPLADRVHENGMRFMVWFEPERVDIGSDTYRMYGDADGWLLRQPKDERNTLLNLGNPDTLSWITDTLITFLKTNRIDVYREDFNFDPLPYWLLADAPGRVGMTEMRFVEGLYSMWDAILASNPNRLIDNCSSGGRRIDLETVSRSIPCWRSDLGCRFDTSEEKVVPGINQNITLALSRYLPYHQTVSWTTEAYNMRSGMTEGMALAFDMMPDSFDTAAAAEAMEEIDVVAKYAHGRFYPLAGPADGQDAWAAWQNALESSGCALAFRRAKAEPDFTLRLRGLDPDAEYAVTVSDEQRKKTRSRYSGSELRNGLALRAEKGPASFLIVYEKI